MGTRTVAFKKENSAQRMVWAEVYAPSRPDSDVEFMRPEEIQKMAYGFMRSMKLDAVDSQHNNELVEGACVVESFIARKGDPDFIEGAWVVGMHIDNDEAWEKVEKGEINGFSMEAMVSKTVSEVTLEVPPILMGVTQKSEDGHQHTFHVAYNDDGRFLGGRTDSVDGHMHIIKRGTVTEEADGHSHRFSHVEDIVIK